jgi:predicted DNA-binding transcriptional regulator YafY
MSYLTATQKMRLIQHWAERKMTGTPEELSKKLEISIRTTFRYINMLRQMDLRIKYNRYRKCYFIGNSAQTDPPFPRQTDPGFPRQTDPPFLS